MPDTWTLKMAWRDSRGSRRRLLLYLSSMVLGVAALVAINGFGANLARTIDRQARTLLGADLLLERSRPFGEEAEALVDSIGGRQARRVSFASMAYFPASGGTRLSTVRAVEGDYPFYGAVVTEPEAAAQTYRQRGEALVDGTLLAQFGAAVGDSVRIGRRTYRVAGRLVETPRESSAIALISPRVYVPRAALDTSLLGFGSRASYEVYFQFDEERDVEALLDAIRPQLREHEIRSTTVAEATADWQDGLGSLARFLSLVGFVALLLGSLGVASAVHVYVRQRMETVAVLRCLGARAGRTFGIYLVQAAALGLVGAVLGCVLGLAVQTLVPHVLADFLPVEVVFFVSWPALAIGLGVGVGVALLFALWPLMAVRRVSPLMALRAGYDGASGGRDAWQWAVGALAAVGIVASAVAQAPTPLFGLAYAAGLAAVLGLLALVARALMAAARHVAAPGWPYAWRQGLANLHRPHNQTTTLMLALGLGAFLVVTLLLVQETLLRQFELEGAGTRPNVVLFDVQPDQLEGVTEHVRATGSPVLGRVPIVAMRLEAVKGRSIDSLRADTTADLTWAHRRQYRSTYRDTLSETEEITAGTFARAPYDGSGAVPVSLEEGIAEELDVGVGDRLTFDVQGVPVEAEVASLRAVDWARVQANFFIVFPPGVLEEAPQTYVVLTRADTEAASARLQQAVVARYPTVSAIDISLVLSVLEALFGRISFVIRFMALFSIATGFIVLAGAVVAGRYQRAEEVVLLKTLGAARGQVLRIMGVEYVLLGALAAAAALVLAVAGAWALAAFVFEAPLALAPGAMALVLAAVPLLTLAIGLLSSRGLYAKPPLEVLRAGG